MCEDIKVPKASLLSECPQKRYKSFYVSDILDEEDFRENSHKFHRKKSSDPKQGIRHERDVEQYTSGIFPICNNSLPD